jgi:hypothetical protein
VRRLEGREVGECCLVDLDVFWKRLVVKVQIGLWGNDTVEDLFHAVAVCVADLGID